MAHLELLAGIDIFEKLDRVALARLAAYLEPCWLRDGEILFRQGDPADGLYVVAQGRVSVFSVAADSHIATPLSTLGRGQYFGEIALMVDEPRTASVRALGDAEVLRLERARFVELIGRNPTVALAVAAKVIGHLRTADRARSGQAGAEEVEVAPSWSNPTPVLMADLRSAPGAPRVARSRMWRTACVVIAAASGLGALAAALLGLGQVWEFLLLLGAAAGLLASELLPSSAIKLSLLAAWIVFRIATPEQAVAGFSSSSWLLIVSIYGLTAAIGRSGLLFRIGLLMVRHLPTGVYWQAGGLLLTGTVLGAVVPTSTGRTALMTPLAQAVSEAMRHREREPGAAVLGMAAWIGAGPMLFAFLNGSSMTLLAWGLLPAMSRSSFDWIHWFVSVLPLTLVVGLGSLLVLMLMLPLDVARSPSPQRLRLQLEVLGPLRRREWAMLAVLGLTLVG